ncbi:hypothetical protein M569_15050, partial [Genlisea aurea]
LRFQEIVPLNAGNVLGSEDNAPARKWLRLIRRTLNGLPGGGGGGGGHCDPIAELEDGFETSSDLFRRRSFQSSSRSDRTQLQPERRHSVCDRAADSWLEVDDDHNHDCGHGSFSSVDGKSKFCMVASKQMVGIFLTVWIKADLKNAVGNLKVSCVGRGLMGYLGNKGSISISMSLHRTSFCFVCSHLSSGERDGDELRRNSDVMEILRKTRFPRGNSPRTILDHDRIVWLGDLNYRISLSYRYAKALVEMQNWRALLENDQLRLEQRNGRVFEGWNEGKICFPPTYKYSNNSDRYAGENVHPKEKRRTPAWCDRILWCGRGLRQLSYVRGESRFSDHRPVYSVFLAEVESVNRNRIKKSMSYSSSRVEVEELLPFDYGYN